MLRLRLGPAAALEIPEEGPELGARVDLIDRFERRAESELALAVFTSEGCHVCRGLEPAIATLAGDPAVAVQTFDEVAEAEVWSELGIPGSPFAIALDPDGAVLAKGTFNNLAQLESVLATAAPSPGRPGGGGLRWPSGTGSERRWTRWPGRARAGAFWRESAPASWRRRRGAWSRRR